MTLHEEGTCCGSYVACYPANLPKLVGNKTDRGVPIGMVSERALDDLQKIMSELEELVKVTLSGAGEQADEAARRLSDGINRACDQLAAFEQSCGREFKHGVRTADRYVHDTIWVAIGIAAGAGFLLGMLVARRD